MDERLDDVDRRVLYRLMADARTTSASAIAEEVDVSARTIRNRIGQLEERGIITGYHASVDFERTGARLTNLFICTAPVPERETLARTALGVPGVINVREVMSGRENLHITAVGTDTNDITRIARALSVLGLDIEEEDLLQREHVQPYGPFGPDADELSESVADFISLTGGAEVVELAVGENATIVGRTIRETDEEGLLGRDTLVVAIERSGRVITPKGNTTIESGDVVTVFSQGRIADETLRLFAGGQSGE